MHVHHHDHSHAHGHELQKNLWWVFVLNISFTVIEFVGGYFTNSVAIWSDAFHDLGDSLAIAMALILERVSHRSSNQEYSYGYRRYSVLSSLLICLILIGGSLLVIYRAVPRLFNPEEVDSIGMLWLAILGVAINGYSAFRLLKGESSMNQKSLMLHLLEDTLGWAAVLIGALVIKFTGNSIVDPILSVLIALWILRNAIKGCWDAIKVILQITPASFNLKEITGELKGINKITDVHDFHVWSMDGEKHIATLHIRLNSEVSQEAVSAAKKKIRSLLSLHKINHVTIEVDQTDDDCQFEDCT